MSQPNPRYVIIEAPLLYQLPAKLDLALADGVWRCVGSPFEDQKRGVWCQSIERIEIQSAPSGGKVNLREPKR